MESENPKIAKHDGGTHVKSAQGHLSTEDVRHFGKVGESQHDNDELGSIHSNAEPKKHWVDVSHHENRLENGKQCLLRKMKDVQVKVLFGCPHFDFWNWVKSHDACENRHRKIQKEDEN